MLTVTATDQDSPTTNNGKIEYGIETGAQGKFVINGLSGAISTSTDASFDYDKERQYILLVSLKNQKDFVPGIITIPLQVQLKTSLYIFPNYPTHEISLG